MNADKRDSHRVSFRFWAQAQPKNAAGILHNRRACSALQGIGGRATNKQSAKSPTIALLARITECSILGWKQTAEIWTSHQRQVILPLEDAHGSFSRFFNFRQERTTISRLYIEYATDIMACSNEALDVRNWCLLCKLSEWMLPNNHVWKSDKRSFAINTLALVASSYILFERKQNDATGFPSESHDRKLFLHHKKFHSILRLTSKTYAMSFVN